MNVFSIDKHYLEGLHGVNYSGGECPADNAAYDLGVRLAGHKSIITKITKTHKSDNFDKDGINWHGKA